jgi:hypothetical protein
MNKFSLQTPNEFVLPDGKKIKIKAVSLARVRGAQNKSRKEMEAVGLNLTPPTYPIPGVVVAPGVEVPTQEYNSETILTAPEDVQKVYAEYQVNKQQLTALTAGNMLITLLLRGTEYEIPDDGWDKRQEDDGMVIPEDPEERYVYYLMTELLVPPVLAQEVAKHILRVSMEGADPKVIDAFEDAFRGPLQVP